MTGWVKLHRKFIQWEWYDDINTSRVFLHILLSANYKDKSWRGISIKRGQFLTSLSTLAKETGLSIKSVRTSLTKLKSTHEVAQEGAKQYSLLTIVKYEEYQSTEDEGANETAHETADEGQRRGKGGAITKEGKKEKKEKKIRNIEALPLPDWLPLDEWNGFLEVRKKKNKTPTNRAIQMLIVKLDELRKQGHDPTAVINQSIINSWSGFFEIKGSYNENIIRNNGNINKQPQGTTSYNDKHQRTLEAAARGHARAQNPDF